MFITIIALIIGTLSIGVAVSSSWKKNRGTGIIPSAGKIAGMLSVAKRPGIPSLISTVVGLTILLLAIGWVFPTFEDKYVAQGGPTWTIFFLLLSAATIFTLGNGKSLSNGIASIFVLFAIGLGMTFTVITWIYGADTSRGAIEEAQRQARQQLAAEAAALRPQYAPGGLRTAAGRLIIEHRPECARKVIDSYTFETAYAPFPANGRCSTDFMYPASACAMYKASEDGPEQGPYGDCPGSKSPSIPADPKFARSIGSAFSVKLTVDQPVTVQTFR